MSETIIVALSGLIGALIGGTASIFSQIIANRHHIKARTVLDMADQLGAYYVLESKYIEEISKLRKQINEKENSNLHDSTVTIQREFRKLAEDETNVTIDITENKAKRIKKDFDF